MVITIVGGTGQQGKGLAKRLLGAGYHVRIGSRDGIKAKQVAKELSEQFPHATVDGGHNKEVSIEAEVVILTIPHGAQQEILGELKSDLRGKVVVDTTVPMVFGKPPQVVVTEAGSSAQRIQQFFGDDVSVVGAFHTVSAHLLNDLSKPLTGDTVICGNEENAKQQVVEIAEKIGLRGINGGNLTVAHTLERITVMLIGMNQLYKKRSIGIQFTSI